MSDRSNEEIVKEATDYARKDWVPSFGYLRLAEDSALKACEIKNAEIQKLKAEAISRTNENIEVMNENSKLKAQLKEKQDVYQRLCSYYAQLSHKLTTTNKALEGAIVFLKFYGDEKNWEELGINHFAIKNDRKIFSDLTKWLSKNKGSENNG